MSDIGGYSPSVGPERYLGRYSNTALGFAEWTYLTSASFYNQVSNTNEVLSANLPFLGLALYNLGATAFYLMLCPDPGGVVPPSPSVSSALMILPNTRTPVTLDVGAIWPQSTTVPNNLAIAIRGDANTPAAANMLILASFTGAYGPA